MNKFRLIVVCITFTTFLSSCSTFNKTLVGSTSDLVYSSGNSLLSESNFEIFKNGVPSILIFMEGLLSQSPQNLNLLAGLSKGYAGYAFAVNESLLAEEEWGEAKTEDGKKQALFNYTRALNFGIKYLKEQGIEFRDIISRMNEPQGIHQILEKKLSSDKRDLEVVLFTAQSLGILINLQKDNMGFVSQLSAVKEMFDWVCQKDSSINYGTCDVFYGAYESGRPQMLGGNPKKGKEIFLKAISKHPHNWLIRTSYMQYYLIPQNDEEGFKEQMLALKIFNEEFNKYYIFDNVSRVEGPWTREEGLRFYQALALKRYEIMTRCEKNFF